MRLDLATFVSGSLKQHDIPENDVVDLLRSNGPGLSAAQAEEVAAILASATSAKIRNAAAIALLDAHYPRLETALNQLLRKPAIATTAGTLLFCLMDSNSRVAADAIPTIVQGGSYEARSELLILTSEGKVSFEHDAELDSVLAQLAEIASSCDSEAAEVASLAREDLEMLRPA